MIDEGRQSPIRSARKKTTLKSKARKDSYSAYFGQREVLLLRLMCARKNENRKKNKKELV